MLMQIVDIHAPVKVAKLESRPNLSALDFRLMKVIPALGIIEAGRRNGLISAATTIVETSSGTMALGLAIVCSYYGLKLRIFGDAAIDLPLKLNLEALGADVEIIEASASDGNVQQLRKQALLRFLENNDAFWAHQYNNPENTLAYSRAAATAIRGVGKIDILVAAVGSGGSSCGLSRYIRKFFPAMMLVGVDTNNSVLFGQLAGPRDFRGLGNSILPENLDHTAFDEVHWLGANEGFHAAHRLLRETTLKRGPTSGAAYLVANWYAARFPDKRVLAVFPDDGSRYNTTVYDPDWMLAHGFAANRLAVTPAAVEHPLQATSGWSMINWRRRTLTDVMMTDREVQR
jgi:cysteine synthase A